MKELIREVVKKQRRVGLDYEVVQELRFTSSECCEETLPWLRESSKNFELLLERTLRSGKFQKWLQSTNETFDSSETQGVHE